VKKSFNRKSLLLPLLLLATGSAWAGWEEIGTSNEVTFYIDRATLRKDGNLRRIWVVMDLKQRDKSGAMSIRTRNEYDCKGERRRHLAVSAHTEPMAGGTLIANENPSGWREIPPGSISEDMLKIACAQ
jgi:hypothetical protein